LRTSTSPLEPTNEVVICSYHFARAKAAEVTAIPWDLVVIDEAHRLRNVYKKDNKIAKALRDAMRGRPKVLLTATPLQNSLMELYGLVTFVDEHVFGSEDAFRELYAKKPPFGDDLERHRSGHIADRPSKSALTFCLYRKAVS
jgi:SNF2 family DNA or RNA helicase